jgi:serine/threonine protein kinase
VYKKIALLNKNIQSEVWLVGEGSSFYILKSLHNDSHPWNILFENEKKIFSMVKHKNIIGLIETGKDFILMEHGEAGSLHTLIKKKPEMVRKHAQYWTNRIVDGLEYLHSLNIVHFDLKVENIFVTKNKKIKIADFGFSQYENSNFFETLPDYILPGTKGITHNNNCRIPKKTQDLYSLGVVLYNLFSLSDPMNGINYDLIENETMKKIIIDLMKMKITTIEEVKALVPFTAFI